MYIAGKQDHDAFLFRILSCLFLAGAALVLFFLFFVFVRLVCVLIFFLLRLVRLLVLVRLVPVLIFFLLRLVRVLVLILLRLVRCLFSGHAKGGNLLRGDLKRGVFIFQFRRINFCLLSFFFNFGDRLRPCGIRILHRSCILRARKCSDTQEECHDHQSCCSLQKFLFHYPAFPPYILNCMKKQCLSFDIQDT